MSAVARPMIGEGSSATAVYASPLVRALGDRIKPVRTGILYRIGLMLVCVFMLLLPLVYLSLVVGAGYLVYLHIVHDTYFLGGHGRAALGRLVLYLAPIFVGGILILFMIKPLFARRRVIQAPLTVSETEQPLLHAFVRKLADVVGAARPKRIDVDCQVNASASFDAGLLGFLRGDLVLTLGLPLVAGLDARQLTGVLAHELGHFAQGGGMRLTYLIRSINGWFARVAYERDAWDDQLDAATHADGHWTIALVAWLAKLFIWVTRQILKLLMLIGHAVSSFMLRQMEFDADRYEARVAGSDAFAQVADRLSMLSIASQAAFSDLTAAWREGRLCDDLPELIRWRELDMPEAVRKQISEISKKAKTGWFDSHPCDRDRINSARREPATGIFNFKAPASSLFNGWGELSRRATVAFYHRQLGGVVRPENLIPTESLIASRGKNRESAEALSRYFQNLIHPVRPVFPTGNFDPISNRAAGAELLLELRSQFMQAVNEARLAQKTFEEADERLATVVRVRAVHSAGIKRVDLKELKLSKGDDQELRQITLREQPRLKQSEQTLQNILTIGMQRLELALRLEETPDDEQPAASSGDADEYGLQEAAPPGSGDRLQSAFQCLKAVAPTLETLRQQYYAVAALLGQCREQGNSEELVGAVLSKARKALLTMTQIQSTLAGAKYPYDHYEKDASIATFVLKQLPPAEAVMDVYQAAETMLDSLYTLYMRIISDLAQRAERVEASLGLPPLPAPADE